MSIHHAPRLTFSALCEFLDATPTRQLSILRTHKYPSDGPMRSYAAALAQVKGYLVQGTPLNPEATNLAEYEREILQHLVSVEWRLPAGATAVYPNTQQATMSLGGVEISVVPDMYLEMVSHGTRRTGAIKFFVAKSRELRAEPGKWMASLLYRYMLDQLHDPSVDPDLCCIYDIRQDEHHWATKSHKRLFQHIENACLLINAVWPRL